MILPEDAFVQWQEQSREQNPLWQEVHAAKGRIWRFVSALVIVGAIILGSILLLFLAIRFTT
jgi:hypothetical protein